MTFLHRPEHRHEWRIDRSFGYAPYQSRWGCVMGESKSRRVRASKLLREHLFLKSRLSPYGRAAIALWPDNAPKIIAERAGISIRNANQIIRGERKVTARCLIIVMDEID